MTSDAEKTDSTDTRCPKCGHRQPPPGPCHRCGLDFEGIEDANDRSWDAVPEDKAEFAEELERRWGTLASDFLDDDKHSDIIAYASVTETVDLLARRYRFYLEDSEVEAERERAEESIVRLVEIMQAQFAASQVGDDELWERRTRIIKGAIYVVVVIMCLAVIALTFIVVRPFG